MFSILIYARTQMLDKYPFEECFGVARKLGFDGVEIGLADSKWNVRTELLDKGYLHHLRDVLREMDIQGYSVSFHSDYIYNDERYEYLKKAVHVARELSSGILIFSTTRKKTGDREEWDYFLARTRELVRIAEDSGVTLANEPEPDFIVGNVEELIRMFDDIPSDNLACNMDLGHAFLCEADPFESIKKVGKKIVHGHIENMKKGIHSHIMPHMGGDMNLADYLKALKETGFDGGIALDVYTPEYEEHAADAVAYIRKLLDSINRP